MAYGSSMPSSTRSAAERTFIKVSWMMSSARAVFATRARTMRPTICINETISDLATGSDRAGDSSPTVTVGTIPVPRLATQTWKPRHVSGPLSASLAAELGGRVDVAVDLVHGHLGLRHSGRDQPFLELLGLDELERATRLPHFGDTTPSSGS